jgi:hypothetical protein
MQSTATHQGGNMSASRYPSAVNIIVFRARETISVLHGALPPWHQASCLISIMSPPQPVPARSRKDRSLGMLPDDDLLQGSRWFFSPPRVSREVGTSSLRVSTSASCRTSTQLCRHYRRPRFHMTSRACSYKPPSDG